MLTARLPLPALSLSLPLSPRLYLTPQNHKSQLKRPIKEKNP